MPDSSPVTDRDVFITRAFDAPVATVWKFFTEPELLAQWFGPDGFDAPLDLVDIDLRVGGHWNLTMREIATGATFPIKGTITELAPEEYLEMAADAETADADLQDLGLRFTFHDHGEKTRVTLHQGEFTDEQKKETAAGWEMSWAKMDRLLSNVPG